MNDKMMNCGTCGAEIAKSAKACPHCGARKKKPIFKKWWFWLIIVFLIIGLLGSSGGDESAEANNETTQYETDADFTPAEDESAADIEISGEETVDVEAIKTMLESILADSFDYFNVEGDETGFTLYMATDGLAADIVAAKAAGYDETYEPWATSRDSIVGLYDSTYELLETFGMKDPSVTLIIVNDANTENYLLVVYDKMIVYDVMAE